jgi:hypothetical protein
MSHSSSRKRVLDDSLPLAHRASHARSCVNHVAARLNISREQLIELLARETGVDLNSPDNLDDLLRAFQHMESLHDIEQ